MRAKMLARARRRTAPIDICGTGGDGAGTLNISTAAAFVVAACGVPVAKHGNRALSSRTGRRRRAGGARREHRCRLTRCASEPVAARNRSGFLFAPRHHGACAMSAPVRGELGMRTIFNLLGPLANPARRQAPARSACSPSNGCEPMAEVLGRLGPSAPGSCMAPTAWTRSPRRAPTPCRRAGRAASVVDLRDHARGCRPAARRAGRPRRAAMPRRTPRHHRACCRAAGAVSRHRAAERRRGAVVAGKARRSRRTASPLAWRRAIDSGKAAGDVSARRSSALSQCRT